MSLDLCILASGSSGNCAAVRTPAGLILIDLGIGPRIAGQRLIGAGVSLQGVKAACLTHLDSDHFAPSWPATLIRQGIRVFCHAGRRDELMNCARNPSAGNFDSLVTAFNGEPFSPIEGLRVEALHLAHDQQGSHGFLFEGFGCRLGYATDLGRVPAELIERFDGVDVLAIESNYDPDMQRTSGRPVYLQKRIMGGRGHLSNAQAFEAVTRILDRGQRRGRMPSHIVLLHRSRQCNRPDLLREFFSRDQRIAGRLTLAEQHHRTDWIRPKASAALVGEQLSLGWE